MPLRPLPGVSIRALQEPLKQTLQRAENVRGGGYDISAYISWADQAVDTLSRLISPADLDRLVTGKRYIILRTLNTSSTIGVPRLVSVEIEERVRELTMEVAEIENALFRWGAADLLFLPDTNVYLHAKSTFNEMPWRDILPIRLDGAQLLLPMLVIDELDRQKRNGKTTTRTRARQTLKIINSLVTRPERVTPLGSVEIPASPEPLYASLTLRVLLEDRNHPRLPMADDEIIDVARSVQDETGRPLHVVTFDTGMVLRAKAADVQAHLLDESQERTEQTDKTRHRP